MGEQQDKPTETGGAPNNTSGQGGEPTARQTGAGVDARLHEVNEEAKKYRLEAKTLKAQNAEIIEQQKAIMAELTAEKQRRETAEALALKTARTAAAAKYGLPEQMAERLKGNTPEEVEADAKALAEVLPKPQTPPPAGAGAASPGNAAAGQPLTMELIRSMSVGEVQKRQAEIDTFLASQKQ